MDSFWVDFIIVSRFCFCCCNSFSWLCIVMVMCICFMSVVLVGVLGRVLVVVRCRVKLLVDVFWCSKVIRLVVIFLVVFMGSDGRRGGVRLVD